MKMHAKYLLIALLAAPLIACNGTKTSTSTSSPARPSTSIPSSTGPIIDSSSVSVNFSDIKDGDEVVNLETSWELKEINVLAAGAVVLNVSGASLTSPKFATNSAFGVTLGLKLRKGSLKPLGEFKLSLIGLDVAGVALDTREIRESSLANSISKEVHFEFENSKIVQIRLVYSEFQGGTSVDVSKIVIK